MNLCLKTVAFAGKEELFSQCILFRTCFLLGWGDNVPVQMMDPGTVREHHLFAAPMRVAVLKYFLNLK